MVPTSDQGHATVADSTTGNGQHRWIQLLLAISLISCFVLLFAGNATLDVRQWTPQIRIVVNLVVLLTLLAVRFWPTRTAPHSPQGEWDVAGVEEQ